MFFFHDAMRLCAEEWEGCAGTEAGADGRIKVAAARGHRTEKGPAAHPWIHAAPRIHPCTQRAPCLCDACQAAAVSRRQKACADLAWKVSASTAPWPCSPSKSSVLSIVSAPALCSAGSPCCGPASHSALLALL